MDVALQIRGGPLACARCKLAETPLARLRGLLGRSRLPPGEGVLLRPASAIHTCFMRFPVDAVFLDEQGLVLRMVPRLPPWHAAMQRGARSVLELAAGECGRVGIRPGVRIEVQPRGDSAPPALFA